MQASTKQLTTRALTAVLRKKEKQVEYWPRLTKDKAKVPYLKTDFSKARVARARCGRCVHPRRRPMC